MRFLKKILYHLVSKKKDSKSLLQKTWEQQKIYTAVLILITEHIITGSLLKINNFIDSTTPFHKINSKRIKLADAEKNLMEFISKLSDLKIDNKKSK